MELKPKINENCELYKGLNVKLYKRCDYCNDSYTHCMGTQYNISMMIIFILLLILPYLASHPLFMKSAILIIVGIGILLGFLVNSKTDDLYLSQFELKNKTFETEKLNHELINLNESLETKTAELIKANKELKKLDQMKSDFISTVSHEFRSPLTSIKAFSELLLNNGDDISEEEREEFLRTIEQESDRLTRLIEDTLDLSKLEAGKMEWNMQNISIADIIKKSTESIYPLSMIKGIRIETNLEEDLPRLTGDPDRLMQVLTNLLNNAVKFTPEEGNIEVTVHVDIDQIQVSVEDSGSGIPENEIQEIFSKFKQGGDTLTDKPKGTGLGLPISREIILAHAGRIWAESKVGKWSRFSFLLPLDLRKALLKQEDKPSEQVV